MGGGGGGGRRLFRFGTWGGEGGGKGIWAEHGKN